MINTDSLEFSGLGDEDDLIFAKWSPLSDRIVVINADTGHVSAEVDLGSLYPRAERRSSNHVMNGIAWDPVGKRLFVTGKNWPRLYHIALEPAFD